MAGVQTKITSLTTRFLERVSLTRLLIAYFVIASVYIYAPMISMIVFSFNEGGITAPFVGFTLEAYHDLFANEALRVSIVRSLQLALVVTVITTFLGTAAGLAYRYEFWGKRGVLYLILLGIIIPGVTFGVGSRLFLTEILGLSRSLWLAVPVHVVWTLPFAVIIILAGFPPTLRQNEEAARVMGADRLTTYREVVIRQITPTVLGAAVFAFTLSYNEAERAILLVGADSTMPIQVFSVATADRPDPYMFALGSITTVLSTILLIFASWLIIRSIQRQ